MSTWWWSCHGKAYLCKAIAECNTYFVKARYAANPRYCAHRGMGCLRSWTPAPLQDAEGTAGAAIHAGNWCSAHLKARDSSSPV